LGRRTNATLATRTRSRQSGRGEDRDACDEDKIATLATRTWSQRSQRGKDRDARDEDKIVTLATRTRSQRSRRSGREKYLESTQPNHMTRKAMDSNKHWPKRFDGLRHASLPVTGKICQYCKFQYTHDFDDRQREANPKMLRNQANVRRCLVCNVNLCPICEIEFHGVRMCESAKLLGK